VQYSRPIIAVFSVTLKGTLLIKLFPCHKIELRVGKNRNTMAEDDSYNGDDNKSNYGSSEHSQNLASAEKRMKAATPELAHRETRLVSCSKIVVLFVLVVATISVATATYKFTSREEEESFNTRVRM
jgi:hypothetical protein